VTVCHNGQTLDLPPQAAAEHLRNHPDDTLGPCPPPVVVDDRYPDDISGATDAPIPVTPVGGPSVDGLDDSIGVAGAVAGERPDDTG
jgi:hypothetical protein